MQFQTGVSTPCAIYASLRVFLCGFAALREIFPLSFILVSFLGVTVWGQPPPKSTAEGIDFFEKRVRPLLMTKCVSCHGEKAPQAGVRLDTPETLRDTTLKGHVLVTPGDPEKSALIAVVRYNGAIKMPPTGKLSDAEIAVLTQWVKIGAPHPDAASGKRSASGALWALQPVVKPPLPEVKQKEWAISAIDQFVLAKLEAKGLTPSPPADRRTLLRRATYDLIGLPPTPEETAAFEADRSPDAWTKVVDRLLADPRYGERWGRHWLDVARYADSRQQQDAGASFPFAYTYRDWVIRAFNTDLPYNTFLTQQIAADCLDLGDDQRPLAALGFLTLGREFLGNEQDIIDDRLDVVMRGTQGLTVTCARCHDHKFDPIPTKDYYALYGVFANTAEKTLPLPASASQKQAFAAFEKERAHREQQATDFLEAVQRKLFAENLSHAADYLMAAQAALQRPNSPLADTRKDGLNPILVERWRQYLEGTKGDLDPIMAPWHALAALPAAKFALQAPALAKRFRANTDNRTHLNWQVAMLFDGAPPASLKAVAERYARMFNDIEGQWQRTQKAAKESGAPVPKGLAVPAQESIRQVLYGENAPLAVPLFEVEQTLGLAERSRLAALRRRVNALLNAPDALPHALGLEDNANPTNAHVLLRGDADNPGEEVPRRFLRAVAGPDRKPFTRGSGRLELAQAITDPKNPLTARVLINRVWMYHFGAGLVRTPGDFGTRGEPPTHPELLDWLAATFMEQGWSIKGLQRTILLTNAYQQSSQSGAEGEKLDPENRLLWRQNRQRLDFEAMRDSLLAAGGDMDNMPGGPPKDLTAQPYTRRRTVYGRIDRDNLPALFRVFDFANPDMHSPQRFVTISPHQALFLMNSPFVIEQACRLAGRIATETPDPEARVRALYQKLFSRDPGAAEVQVGLRFLKSAIARQEPAKPIETAWRYGYGHYDPQTQRVTTFTPLPFWSGETWMGGRTLPDPSLGNLFLNATGGGPGDDADHNVIRRWIAPRDGVVSIEALLKHTGKDGDGVLARIVSSRSGALGSWQVQNREQSTPVEGLAVKQGDTLDFVVDCRDNDLEDNFLWAPIITLSAASPSKTEGGRTVKIEERPRPQETEGSAPNSAGKTRWSAEADFAGPVAPPHALTPWEKYVQALLLSNEFAFVE